MTWSRRRAILGLSSAAGLGWPAKVMAQAPSSLDRIKSSGKLRIGVTTSEPWYYKDGSGDWKGIGVEFGQLLARDLGVALATVETTWPNAVPALQADRMDIMLVLDPTPERRAAVDFPEVPLFFYAAGVLVHADETASRWTELNRPGLRVGVTLGTAVDRLVTEMLPSASLRRFSTNDETGTAFATHKIDAAALVHPGIWAQFFRLGVGKVVLPNPITPIATSAGIQRTEDASWRKWLDEAFARYYGLRKPQEFFDSYLRARNVDPALVVGLVKEDWPPAASR